MIDFKVNWAGTWQNVQNKLCAQRTPSSLHICTVWSVFARRSLGNQCFLMQIAKTLQMHRLIWVFTGCTCHFAGFVELWLKSIMIFTLFPGCEIRSVLRRLQLACRSLVNQFFIETLQMKHKIKKKKTPIPLSFSSEISLIHTYHSLICYTQFQYTTAPIKPIGRAK